MTKQILFTTLCAMALLGLKAQTTNTGEETSYQVSDYLKDSLVNEAVIMEAGSGESLSVLGSTMTFKLTTASTDNQLGLYEVTLKPKVSGAKLHYHRFMDETFVVTQGTLTIQLPDREVELKAGGIVHIPRFTPHGFYNSTDEEVKALMLFNPPQHRENFFRGMQAILSEEPVDASKFLELYHKYDSHPINETDAEKILKR